MMDEVSLSEFEWIIIKVVAILGLIKSCWKIILIGVALGFLKKLANK